MKSVDAIRRKERLWRFGYYFWTSLHYVLGLSSVILASLAASQVVGDELRAEFSLAAAIAVAALTFLRPAEIAFGFDQASERLSAALINYDFAVTQGGRGPVNEFAKLYQAFVEASGRVSDIQPYKTNVALPPK